MLVPLGKSGSTAAFIEEAGRAGLLSKMCGNHAGRNRSIRRSAGLPSDLVFEDALPRLDAASTPLGSSGMSIVSCQVQSPFDSAGGCSVKERGRQAVHLAAPPPVLHCQCLELRWDWVGATLAVLIGTTGSQPFFGHLGVCIQWRMCCSCLKRSVREVWEWGHVRQASSRWI